VNELEFWNQSCSLEHAVKPQQDQRSQDGDQKAVEIESGNISEAQQCGDKTSNNGSADPQ